MSEHLPPLLGAWTRYARMVLHARPEESSDELLTFMAGATAIIELVRDAKRKGGAPEAARAFNMLAEETDAFLVVTQLMEAGDTEH